MNAEQFLYWIRGYFEITQPSTINEKETKVIKEHLDRVFNAEPTTFNPGKVLYRNDSMKFENLQNTSTNIVYRDTPRSC